MCVWCCLMEHMLFLFLYPHSYIHIHCSDFRFDGFSSCYRRYIAMVEMCQVAGNRDQLITLLLPLAEHVLNVILIHFQDGYDLFFFLITYCHFISLFQCVFLGSSITPGTSATTKAITFGDKFDNGQDISVFCGKLIPTLERLELLSEVCCFSLSTNHRFIGTPSRTVISNLEWWYGIQCCQPDKFTPIFYIAW